MTKADYQELERLNREMLVPLEAFLSNMKNVKMGDMGLDAMKNMIILHNNRLKIKALLEKEEPPKGKFKQTKMF